MSKRTLLLFGLMMALIVTATLAWSQDAKLVDAVKKEGGKAVAYGSLETETLEPVKKAFEKKTGLKVEYWRASGTKVMDRALGEYRAGRPLYDVVITNRNPMVLMKDSGLFARYESASWKGFPPDVMDEFFGPAYRYNVFGILYNTKLIKPADAPKSLEDILKAQYKGKVVISDPTQHSTIIEWFANLPKVIGKERADKFIRDLAATRPLMVESFLPAVRRAVTGETPIATGFLKWVYTFGKREGAPLDYMREPSYLGEGHFVALASKAPHTNAGKAFLDFFLSREGVQMIAEEGEFVPLKGLGPKVPGSENWKVVEMDVLSGDEIKKKRDEYKKMFFGS
jgi:iron(III) transport system substrate-binding protein